MFFPGLLSPVHGLRVFIRFRVYRAYRAYRFYRV